MIYPIKIQNSSFKEAQWNTQKPERLMILATQYMNKRCLSEKNHKKNQTKNRAELPDIFEGNEIIIWKRYGHACRLSRVWLLATLWTVVLQSPLSMGFPRQEYQSGLLFPSPGIFMIQGLNSLLLCILHYRQIVYPLSHQGSPIKEILTLNFLSFLKIIYWDIINM